MAESNTSSPEVQLSDEQVDMVNSYEPVKSARRAFLRALRDKNPVVKQLEVQYMQRFQERLEWVIANPPEPKKAPQKLKGFGQHA